MKSTRPSIAEIREKLSRYFSADDYFVFLFGSRAAGQARPNSDWDIGVIGRERVGGRIMEKAREELETIRTLHTFELVDFANISEDFKNIAMQNIKPLIGKQL